MLSEKRITSGKSLRGLSGENVGASPARAPTRTTTKATCMVTNRTKQVLRPVKGGCPQLTKKTKSTTQHNNRNKRPCATSSDPKSSDSRQPNPTHHGCVCGMQPMVPTTVVKGPLLRCPLSLEQRTGLASGAAAALTAAKTRQPARTAMALAQLQLLGIVPQPHLACLPVKQGARAVESAPSTATTVQKEKSNLHNPAANAQSRVPRRLGHAIDRGRRPPRLRAKRRQRPGRLCSLLAPSLSTARTKANTNPPPTPCTSKRNHPTESSASPTRTPKLASMPVIQRFQQCQGTCRTRRASWLPQPTIQTYTSAAYTG
eukprot:m.22190 g.22190  ORF g.22190 m.22190 type:complete len:316 (+) comp6711_c0_seq2:364-1311(+)